MFTLSTRLIPQPCDLCDIVTEKLIELTFADPLDKLRFDVHAIRHQFFMVAGWQIAEGREAPSCSWRASPLAK